MTLHRSVCRQSKGTDADVSPEHVAVFRAAIKAIKKSLTSYKDAGEKKQLEELAKLGA